MASPHALERRQSGKMLCEQERGDLTQSDWLQIKHWNQAVPEEYHVCVHHVFEQEVAKHPEAPAVCAWDGDLTYDELNTLSTKLSYHLMSIGVKSGTYVPFCFEKSLWTIVATAAILKAGGAYVPLDPSHPRDRILGILEEVGAKIVLTTRQYTDTLSGCATKIVTVSANSLEQLEENLPEGLHTDVRPVDPALVFFTSGSTGRPKGVVLQHAAIATNARSHGEALHIHRDSRVLQFAAHGWDVATMDMWTTLMRGGCVCVPSERDRRSDITGAMERMRVNWTLLTPSFVDLLQPADVPGLKLLVLAGEPMRQDIIHKWSENVRLFNAYGPAETGVCTAVEYPSRTGRAESIGKQLAANICWIVDIDNHEKLVPIGSIGQLLVEGPNLALEYLNDETKTNLAFVEAPKWIRSIPSRPRRKLYKTGDLVRYCPDGSMDFIGRKDNQVKIRGQRVELSEIESIVEMHSRVSRALVSYPKKGPFKGHLVAIVQPGNLNLHPRLDSQIRPIIGEQQGFPSGLRNELSAFLSERLPSHMLFDVVIMVHALPLSSSAKMDRARVETWLLSMSAEDAEKVHCHGRALMIGEPLSQEDTALKLSAMLAEIADTIRPGFGGAILGHNVILMDLGIDSIQYIKLLMFIKRTWGVSVPLARLTGSKTTVQELARYIDTAGENGGDETHLTSAKTLLADVDLSLRHLKSHAKISESRKRITLPRSFTILLTGSTGFLGIQILRHLLLQPAVKRVVSHVRADSEHHGFKRIVDVARKSGWWQDEHAERLEVWVGDLAAGPLLGLSKEQWDRIRGFGENPIDAIIHNGARVHWMHDYETLKPTNVNSTVSLLRASLVSTSVSRFIYVSGGQQLRVQEWTDQERAQDAVNFNGYAQTKLVSELLVRGIGRLEKDERGPCRFLVVKPGYIIGTVKEGIANPDDFVWRLAAGVIEVKGYSLADQKSFLFVSSADRVANVISNSCLRSVSGSDNIISIFDGVTMEEFWAIFQACCYDLRPMEKEEWLRRLRKTTASTGERHPLYACLDMIEKENVKIASRSYPPNLILADEKVQIQTAIRNNVKYLSEIGFFPYAKMI